MLVRIKKMNIRQKLILGFGGIFLAVYLISIVIMYLLSNQTINKMVDNELNSASESASSICNLASESSMKNNFQKEISKVKIGQSGYIYIVNSQGDVIFSPIENSINLYSAKDSNGYEYIKKMCLQKTGRIRYVIDKDGNPQKMIADFKYIDSLDWIVVAAAYESEITRPIQKQNKVYLLLLLISMGIIIPYILIVSRSFTMPICRIRDILKNAEKGDLTKRIQIHTGDEFEELADGFNKYFDVLSEIIRKIHQIAGTITHSVQEIASSSNEISTTANEQLSCVHEITSTMDQNVNISSEITNKTGSVFAIASKTETDVKNGFEVMEKNKFKMREIKDKNNVIIDGIMELGNKIHKISDIVKIINKIADQTKIIAFNAAIEASSAGEMSNRFNAVADEINRLVDNVVNATKDIKEQIKEMQDSASQLVLSSEEGTDKIMEGQELIKKLEEIFKEILSGAANTRVN